MANSLRIVPEREIHYFRQRQKNRVFAALTAFFASESVDRGFTKRDVSEALGRDPAQISRWFSQPSNLTLDTVSDLLTALDAEMEVRIVKHSDKPIPNFEHPLATRLSGNKRSQPEIVVRPQPTPVGLKRSRSGGADSPAELVVS